jgi:glycosyltransferase involved in cell wall biosynthesis
VHFNQIKYLQQCLKQYARQTLPKNKFQVVIADDGTPGGIDNVVQAFPMMNIKVVTNPRNDPNIRRNPAQVLNVGMANVDAPIGVWHSADIIPCNTNNLQIMFDFHKRNAGRRVRGRLVKLDKNTTNNIFSGRLKSVDCASPRLYHAPSSFNLCDVMTIGGFSQCFKSWGWEDSDFARRMHGIGADTKHDERLSYVHLYHPSHNMGIKGESRSIFNAIAGHMTSVHKL